jgi:adenylate cyclase
LLTSSVSTGPASGAQHLAASFSRGLWLAVPALLLSAAAGIVFTLIFGGGPLWISAVHGLLIGSCVLGFERGLIWPSLHDRIQRLPTLHHIPAAEAAYLVCITIGHVAAVLLLWRVDPSREPLAMAVVPSGLLLTYGLLVSALIVSMLRVRDLIGTDVFVSLLTGRYHRPIQEERIFLFLDVVGSTAYAERHGDLRAQEFLAAIFAALAEPVRRHRGAIDDYVGDMAMVTWPLARGVKDARCVACVFEFLEAVERDAPAWRQRFGQVPQFRAALHGGSVVTAEVGVDRHKISYFGDVVNTTGRMEALCRTLGTDLLISSDLFERLPALPGHVATRSLGTHAVKGRGQRLKVLALEARPA